MKNKKHVFCRKSQMEILGLAVVVLLILLTTIFVVRFLALKSPADYRKSFVSSQLASNMLGTFLKTAADDCFKLRMDELLKDCAQTSGAIICEDGTSRNSCDYAKTAAELIFQQTLSKWNMKYEFFAYTDSGRPIIKLGSRCKAEKKSKTFPVPTDIGTMNTTLDICG